MEHAHGKGLVHHGHVEGIRKDLAQAALDRGDAVIATARDADTLTPLVETYGEQVQTLPLDVTDKAAVERAITTGHERFGRLDVVVNNAGYGLFGTVEEVSEEQARAQIETNLFGTLWVTKAALPILREQGSGHIVQVSSIGGVQAFPTVGLYHASKWGLEGFSQALAAEVASFGIKVTIVEPTGYTTDWGGPSAVRAERIAAYEPMWEQVNERFGAVRSRRGDPEATGPAILEIVDAEEPPLRVFFGDGPLGIIREEYARRLEEWERWSDLSVRAHGSAE